MVDEEIEGDESAALSGSACAVLDSQKALAAVFARGVLRVLAKRTRPAETTCLSAPSKPCLDRVDTERSR